MIGDDFRDIEAEYIRRRDASDDEGQGDLIPSEVAETPGIEHPMNTFRGREEVIKVLRECTTEQLTYLNTLVIVLDSRLTLDLAFKTLLENRIRCAPVFDYKCSKYVGVLSISDLVDSLTYLRNALAAGSNVKGLHCLTIMSWREFTQRNIEDSWTAYINADASLQETCHTLQDKRLHILPVLDRNSNQVVDILTHSRIFRFVYTRLQALQGRHREWLEQLLDMTAFELGIGTYSNILTFNYSSSVASAVNAFFEKKISYLPIVDENGGLVDLYNRSEILQYYFESLDLAMNITVHDAIHAHRKTRPHLPVCKKTSSLKEVFDIFRETRLHRVFFVDEMKRIVGVISLRDVFHAFL
ncbi:hypothetical protein NDN08_005092 [Rhodosorus marinus]|uniref:CBS domain-containing protein n=1 Tax=Rhodosorus marinus TaxID=101924 RepID=A0AAV8V389_9RHOD|nr:hypothetical protein NDN08_005092 [Rhodosorus marinus]